MSRRRSLPYRIVRSVLVLALLLTLASLAFLWYVGAWNVVFPSKQHDSVAPLLPAELSTVITLWAFINAIAPTKQILKRVIFFMLFWF